MEEQIKIMVYTSDDVKKSGGFKKKNNIKGFNKEDFFKYLKENNLNIKSQYFDYIGEISNNSRFRCSYKNLTIGTSKIVEEFNLLNQMEFTENAERITKEFKAKLKSFIIERINQSEDILKENNTAYEYVLNNEDTEGYNETSEINNFEGGVISALKELQTKFNI